MEKLKITSKKSTLFDIRSRQSQTCVKYRDIIICIKRNTDVNTNDLKILHKKCPNKVDFHQLGPLGRVGLVVDMSVCLSV